MEEQPEAKLSVSEAFLVFHPGWELLGTKPNIIIFDETGIGSLYHWFRSNKTHNLEWRRDDE